MNSPLQNPWTAQPLWGRIHSPAGRDRVLRVRRSNEFDPAGADVRHGAQ